MHPHDAVEVYASTESGRPTWWPVLSLLAALLAMGAAILARCL